MTTWNESQPIFVQIRQRLAQMILRGEIAEGEALPSIRQIAVDLSVNPLTVTRAFQLLADLEVIEKRRGLGMYLAEQGRAKLLAHEREKFLTAEWPRIRTQIDALELDLKDLLNKEISK